MARNAQKKVQKLNVSKKDTDNNVNTYRRNNNAVSPPSPEKIITANNNKSNLENETKENWGLIG